MNLFFDFLLENKGKTYSMDYYRIKIYSDGMNGNIKKHNETILCRFCMEQSKQKIWFSFAKECCTTEFGYKKFPILYSEDITEIKKIEHKDAKELSEVISKFLAI